MNASMRVRAGCLLLLGWMLAGLAGAAWAQGGAPVSPVPLDGGISSWLARLRHASSIPSFVGTYVVTSASGAMTSARIWHACEGEVQLERIDVLNGPQRSSYRRNDVVSLLEPGARLIRVEQREAGGRFPNLLGPADDETIAANYRLNTLGRERVAGLDADIAELAPVDELRYGYRIWSERETALILKIQTLDGAGRVLEQSAFSDVELDPPVPWVKQKLAMPDVEGFRIEKNRREPVDAAREGWKVEPPLPGFTAQACYRRTLAHSKSALQWVFSDGLASVSMFIERFDAARHRGERASALGATHVLVRRWPDPGGAWWVTLVGEVPPQTLDRLLQGLRRSQ